MRKDQNALPSSSNSSPLTQPLSYRQRSSAAGDTHLQFFVRILSDHTLVLQADSSDTIRSIHEKIQSITGISITEQRLIHRGKQLLWEQTLADCNVHNDASLNLVGRMRSTPYRHAWLLVDDVVSTVFSLYKNNPPILPEISVQSKIRYFLADLKDKSLEAASDYLQIFKSSSAHAALVMLYMSSHKPNRESADVAIRYFICSLKNPLPKEDTVLLVLEFCRLLNKAAGIGDPLYGFCRSILGKLVSIGEIEIGSKNGLIGDIFPFVNELAAKLSHDLELSTESTFFYGLSPIDVADFSSFLVAIKNEIKRYVGFGAPIRVPIREDLCRLPLHLTDDFTVLHGIFIDLLSQLEKVLVKIEEHLDGENRVLGWYEYLPVLKELNSISKLYYGCEVVFWETMKRRKGALCYLIVRFARREDDNNWILECKEATNFEARRRIAELMLPEVKDEFNELHEMLIDRSHLLAESYGYIVRADLEALRAGLFVEFKNEEATGNGVLREWFFLVCQEIFDPRNSLFVACPNDRRRFFPNPASNVDPLHLEYFSFSGKVIALALMHKVQIGIVLDRTFFLQLAGRKITLEDIRDADPYLYSRCKQILEMDPDTVDQDVLGLTFVDEKEELGTGKAIELCPNGKSVAVDSKNRGRYIDSLIQHRFVTSVAEQVAHFSKGFADIVNETEHQRSFFRCLNPEDLDFMLLGSESEISVDDWRAHT